MKSIALDDYIKGKKGQITIFIIIGIIILLSVITIIYIRSRVVKEELEVGVEEATEVPDWAREVRPFVEKCIQDIAIKAFKKIGEHGGYIDFEDFYLSGSFFNINPGNPTESDAVSFSTKSKAPVAYWWYMTTPNECNDCTVSSIDPSLEFIEQQVNQYMNRELPPCLNDFKVFREMGFQFEAGNPDTDTTINLNTVDVTVNRPTEIKLGDKTVSINKFKVILDLDFYHNYMAAALIAYHQTTEMFLEDILMHLVSIYSSVPDSKKIPPIAWIDNKESIVTWKKSDVKKRIIQDLLSSNIPLLQVNNTKSPTRLSSSDPMLQGLYDIMFLDALPEGFENMDINFLYNPDWEIHFDITPSSGDILKPLTTKTDDTGIGFFPTVTTNFYEFFYDLSFPVIIVIKDDSSLRKYGEEGYKFVFALEANIRDNKNLYLWNQGKGTIGPIDYSGVSFSLKNTVTNATACLQVNGTNKWKCPRDNQIYDNMGLCVDSCQTQTTFILDPTLTPSLICDYEQRISKDITIKTFDARTNAPLSDVPIIFGCGNYRKCPMEATDESGIYISPFPICIGDGYLKLDKEGYMSKYVADVSIGPDTSTTYDVYLEPIREKQIEAVYINVTNLFRIKRKLYSQTGSSILDELYYKTVQTMPFGPPIITHHGILGEMYYGNSNSAQKNQILSHGTKIDNARDSIRGIEYYHQVDKSKIIEATHAARDAADYTWSLVNSGSVSLGEPYRSQLQNHFIWLNKEIENIQFLKGSEVYNTVNINSYRNNAHSLREKEAITISYQKIKENAYEQNLPSVITEVRYGETTTISLVPGTYEINMIFRDDKGFIIPAQGAYPEVDYTPAMLGGAELNNKTGLWTINKAELDSKNKVRFYFFRIDAPENIEELGEIGTTADYSKLYRPYIEPEFLP